MLIIHVIWRPLAFKRGFHTVLSSFFSALRRVSSFYFYYFVCVVCFVCISGPFQWLMQTRGFKTAVKWLFHVYVEPKLLWSWGTLTIWLGTENQREMMLGYVIVWQYSALLVVVVSRAWILEPLVFTCSSHTRKNILTVVSTRFGVYSLTRCELVWRLWICIFSQSFGFPANQT